MTPSILIADDDPQIILALKLLLKAHNFDVVEAHSPVQAIEQVAKREFDVALIDLNYKSDTTSGAEGLALIPKLKQLDELLPIVVMTGYSNIDIAVDVMKLGANDFVQKPWSNERLLTILQSQVTIKQSQRRGVKLAAHNELLSSASSLSKASIVAESAVMIGVLRQLEKLAKSDMSIMLTGENGCGKSMFADYIHRCSGRCDESFVSVNMGAISENLFESEMFGHVKGAFTDAKSQRIGRFEVAESGTIFLDEIANIPLSQQAKLLRVLEEHKFEKLGSSKTQLMDVRLISATNSSLEQLIADNQFRQDLLYRLNTIEIRIPPLRERVDDIKPLAVSFLALHNKKYQLSVRGFSEEALLAMRSYHWPGNVRELNHMVERALFLSSSDYISAQDLGLCDEEHVTEHAPFAELFEQGTLDQIECELIKQRMSRCDNNVQETSTSLGLSRSAYYRRLEKYSL